MKIWSNISKFLYCFLLISTVILFSGCSPEYVLQQGVYSYNNKDYLYSAGAFNLVINQQPDNIKAYYWLGKSYSAAGDYETAITIFKKAIELSEQDKIIPTNYSIDKGEIYFALANAYLGKADYEEAGKLLSKLNTIAPNICTNKENLTCTQIFDYADQQKDAIDLQNRVNYPEIDISRKYRILSYLNLRDHNYDNAINLSAKAIEQKPDNEIAYYLIGMAWGEKGQSSKAVDAIRKAIQVKTDNIVSPKKLLPMYTSLAYYLMKDNQPDAAMIAYNDAIQVSKMKFYPYYYTVNYSTGPVKYSRNVPISFDDYTSMITLALIYYNSGKYDEALDLLNSYINKTDIGVVGLYLRDSYYLRSSFDFYNYVFSVNEGSSAAKEGLQFGDRILEVNGRQVKNKTPQELVNQITGPIGTEVTIKIERINNPFKKDNNAEKMIFEKKLLREKIGNKLQQKMLAKAYAIRSLTYRAQGELEKADFDAYKAFDYCPDSFDAKLAWGYANLEKGKYNEALTIFSSAKKSENDRLFAFDAYFFISLFPSDDELVKLGKAIAYLKLGKVSEAVNYIPEYQIPTVSTPISKIYQSLTGELNKIAQDHNSKGLSLHEKGFLKEALKEYSIAFSFVYDDKTEDEIRNNILTLLQEYPVTSSITEDARKYLIRGEVLFKQGDTTGALQECKKGLKLAPYEPKFYYNIAELNGGLQYYDKAIKYMNLYLKLSPNATDSQNAKDEITKWEFLQERK